MCASVCLSTCVCWFCPLDVWVSPLHYSAIFHFSALWGICRLCTQNCSVFLIFLTQFPFISYVWSFLTEDHECDNLFFYAHLIYPNHALNLFLCSHSKCHKSHQVSYHSNEVVIFKNSKRKILSPEVTEERTRVELYLDITFWLQGHTFFLNFIKYIFSLTCWGGRYSTDGTFLEMFTKL